MENKLKPCHFCGNKNVSVITDNVSYSLGIYDAETDGEVHFRVICSVTSLGCGASNGWKYSKEEAVNDWNGRKGVKDDE